MNSVFHHRGGVIFISVISKYNRASHCAEERELKQKPWACSQQATEADFNLKKVYSSHLVLYLHIPWPLIHNTLHKKHCLPELIHLRITAILLIHTVSLDPIISQSYFPKNLRGRAASNVSVFKHPIEIPWLQEKRIEICRALHIFRSHTVNFAMRQVI